MSSTLERIRLKEAENLLKIHQDELRILIRENPVEKANKTPPKPAQTPKEIWQGKKCPTFEGQKIMSLSKERSFWEKVDFTKLSLLQLRAIAELLGLDTEGRKVIMIARLQDWANIESILARKAKLEKQNARREKLEATGSVFAFGSNSTGQLGLGNRESKLEPTEVESLKGQKIVKLFTGFDTDFAFALSANGEIYGWGGGGNAPLGFSTANRRVKDETFLFPQVIKSLRVEDIVHLSCARTNGHVAAISEGGQAFTWGNGDYGELGTGATITGSQQNPYFVKALSNSILVDINVGNSHTVAITDSGIVYAWGACWSGQLGIGQTKRIGLDGQRSQMSFPSPTILTALRGIKITKVSCGAVHTALISSNGHLYTFGCGDGGRLGLGSNRDMLQPELVDSLKSNCVLEVCCSSWHTLCIVCPKQKFYSASSNAGWVYSFGNGLNGQLGLGKQRNALLPTRIPEFVNRKIKCISISVSSYHCAALSHEGEVYTWGRSLGGCLGRYSQSPDSLVPEVVDNVKGWGNGPVISVSCGNQFTLVLTSPWKGSSKECYKISSKLNKRLKHEEHFDDLNRLKSNQFDGGTEEDENLIQSKGHIGLIRRRKSSVSKFCPGFELDGKSPINVYTCKHCQLSRRLHDIH